MNRWKQVLAAAGSAALLVSNLGIVPQMVYAAETTQESAVETGTPEGTESEPTEETEVEPEEESTEETGVESGEIVVEAEKEQSEEDSEEETKEESKETADEENEEDAEDKTEEVTKDESTEKAADKAEKSSEEADKGSEAEAEKSVEADEKSAEDPSTENTTETANPQDVTEIEVDETTVIANNVEIGGTEEGETETSEPGTATGSIVDGEDSSARVIYTGSWGEDKVSVGGEFVEPAEIKDKETGDILGEGYSDYDTDDYTVKAVFDLSYLVDGEESEPEDPVTVSIDSQRLSSWRVGEAVTIYHIKDNGRKEIVAMNAAVKDGEMPMSGKVTFTTSGFSPFLLTDDYIDEVYIDASDATIKKTGEIQAHILQNTGEDSDVDDVYGKGWKDITERILATDGLTFTWSKTDANGNAVDIEDDAISDDNGSVLLVKDSDDDLGNGKLYTFTIADQSDNELSSDAATVKYYKSFLNSSFEEPSIGNSSWSGVAMKNTKWTTTDSKGQVELGIYSNTSYDAHGAGLDYYNQETNGKQYAELNANSAGTLYQDVLTYGDIDLSWSLLHRARTARKPTMKVGGSSVVTDTMYAVIMSKDDAEKVSTSQATIEAMIAAVAQDGKAHDYAVPGTDTTVKVTVWKISTKTTTEKTADGAINSSAKGDEDSMTGTYSDTTGWAQYKGTYTVPEGQYLTRFFFVAGKTGNNNKAVGNLLDEVYFAQAIPVSVKGTINWVDNDDVDGIRPDDLTVTVYDGDGNVVGTAKITIDADGNWTYALNDLDQYDDDGNEIAYTVKVTSVDGYEAEIEETEKGTVITMTHKPETAVSGKITWADNDDADGIRPEDVTVTVYDEDGNVLGTAKVTADKDGNWTYSIDELPRFDENGKEIDYSGCAIKVSTVDGYEAEVDGLNATLTHVPETSVAGKITWVDNDDADGIRPEDVTVTVYDKDGKKVGETKVTVDKDGNWTYSIDELPRFDEDGKEIEYTVKVSTVDGYEAEVDGTDVTFTHEPKTAVNGKITWVDGDDADGIRPDDVTITVYDKDGNKVGEAKVTVDKDGNWTYSIDELPRFDENGREIEYTVKVSTVDGYEAVVDGTNVTLTHEPKKDEEPKKTESKTESKKSEKHDGGKYAAVDFYLVDDATNKPLSSGTFALYKANGELVGTYTTDANGHIAFPNLKGGTYYLQQVSAPDGYNVNATRLNFTVDGTNLALMLTDTAVAAANIAVTAPAGTEAAANVADTAATARTGAGEAGISTGDESHMMVYGAAAAMAALMLAGWFVVNRRRAN